MKLDQFRRTPELPAGSLMLGWAVRCGGDNFLPRNHRHCRMTPPASPRSESLLISSRTITYFHLLGRECSFSFSTRYLEANSGWVRGWLVETEGTRIVARTFARMRGSTRNYWCVINRIHGQQDAQSLRDMTSLCSTLIHRLTRGNENNLFWCNNF